MCLTSMGKPARLVSTTHVLKTERPGLCQSLPAGRASQRKSRDSQRFLPSNRWDSRQRLDLLALRPTVTDLASNPFAVFRRLPYACGNALLNGVPEGEVLVPADDHTRVFRLLATSLQILAAPLPPSADISPAGEDRAQSPAMRHVMALAARVAPLDSTVLITGESGVGKERLARWLHRASPRVQKPFVAVNCGAFADTLLESELFGHARGAFTGATQDRLGVFEAATGGTLFLDEIGEVSPTMQVKLLRVIQERELIRLGETKVRPVDARLIAATNRDLLEDVAQHRYRRDLYYRVRVIDLHVPPLRERPDELPALARDLLAQTAARLRRPVVGYTPRAFACLLDYLWPGNIRELEHAIERACAVATGSEIDVEDLPAAVRGSYASARRPDQRPLADRELAYIQAVLDRHDGNRRRAAEDLGMSLSTLKRRLRRRTRTP